MVQWLGLGAFFFTAVDTRVQSLVGEPRPCKPQRQKKKRRQVSFSDDRAQPQLLDEERDAAGQQSPPQWAAQHLTMSSS